MSGEEKAQKPSRAVKWAKERADKAGLPPTTTVKISSFLREYIVGKADWNESIDHALRRFLGLPPADGQPPAPPLVPDKKAVKDAIVAATNNPAHPTITVKISRFLREYITVKAKNGESIDETLRKLLLLPLEEKAAS